MIAYQAIWCTPIILSNAYNRAVDGFKKESLSRIDFLSFFILIKFYSALMAIPIAFSPKCVPITGPK